MTCFLIWRDMLSYLDEAKRTLCFREFLRPPFPHPRLLSETHRRPALQATEVHPWLYISTQAHDRAAYLLHLHIPGANLRFVQCPSGEWVPGRVGSTECHAARQPKLHCPR